MTSAQAGPQAHVKAQLLPKSGLTALAGPSLGRCVYEERMRDRAAVGESDSLSLSA